MTKMQQYIQNICYWTKSWICHQFVKHIALKYSIPISISDTIIQFIQQCTLSNRSQEPAPESLWISQIIHCWMWLSDSKYKNTVSPKNHNIYSYGTSYCYKKSRKLKNGLFLGGGFFLIYSSVALNVNDPDAMLLVPVAK